jgi:hypothetical protein
VDLYTQSPIRLHEVVLNYLSTGTTFSNLLNIRSCLLSVVVYACQHFSRLKVFIPNQPSCRLVHRTLQMWLYIFKRSVPKSFLKSAFFIILGGVRLSLLVLRPLLAYCTSPR